MGEQATFWLDFRPSPGEEIHARHCNCGQEPIIGESHSPWGGGSLFIFINNPGTELPSKHAFLYPETRDAFSLQLCAVDSSYVQRLMAESTCRAHVSVESSAINRTSAAHPLPQGPRNISEEEAQTLGRTGTKQDSCTHGLACSCGGLNKSKSVNILAWIREGLGTPMGLRHRVLCMAEPMSMIHVTQDFIHSLQVALPLLQPCVIGSSGGSHFFSH